MQIRLIPTKLLWKRVALASIHVVIIVLAAQCFLKGMIFGFVVNGPQQDSQSGFIGFGYMAFLPISILGVFAKRIAGILLLISSILALLFLYNIDAPVSYVQFRTQFALSATLLQSFSAVVLTLMAWFTKEPGLVDRLKRRGAKK